MEMAASKKAGIIVVAFSVLAFVPGRGFSPRPPSPQESDVSDAPGPLSAFHAERPGIKTCSSCHTPDKEVAPTKCLFCHDEIASRVKKGLGFHRDKAGDCGTCHAEHQGPDAKLVPLDPGDFDHAETGFVLEGAHARVKECGSCHYGKAAFRRTNGRSYLLPDARCSACHDSPHPGRQEECLVCHSKDGWRNDSGPAVKW
jgi:hypothetical protein